MARKPKEIDEEKMLRHYLRRQIADVNKKISGRARQIDGYSSVFADIIGGFANPYKSNDTDILRDIYDDIRCCHKSSSVYNYFDLDTLYAYYEYIKFIFKNIEKSRREQGRYTCRPYDFDRAIESGCRWLIKNKGKEESGFYSLDNPIGVMYKDGELSPERTLSHEDFNKRYDDIECVRTFESYMTYKHGKEKPDFEYKGELYYTEHKELYVDGDGYPVLYIDAINSNARIMGYFDRANNEYHGDLYDTEGNFMVSAEDTGVTLYENKEKRQRLNRNIKGREM